MEVYALMTTDEDREGYPWTTMLDDRVFLSKENAISALKEKKVFKRLVNTCLERNDFDVTIRHTGERLIHAEYFLGSIEKGCNGEDEAYDFIWVKKLSVMD